MWTRGKDKEQPGKFAYELFDGAYLVARVGGFDTAQQADRAAEQAQRAHLAGRGTRYVLPRSASPEEMLAMTDEELLKELGL